MSLIDLLPSYYRNSAEIADLQQAFEHWTEDMQLARNDLLLQMNVNTATWGLQNWENVLGLEIDVSKPDEYRRTRILSKLRGAGTTTKKMIQNVSESFSNGEVEVVEHSDEYRFEVKFIGTLGIPPNMEDLTAAIEEIKPAHLTYAYIFTYLTWNDFDLYNKTWTDWDALDLTWDEFETYKEAV